MKKKVTKVFRIIVIVFLAIIPVSIVISSWSLIFFLVLFNPFYSNNYGHQIKKEEVKIEQELQKRKIVNFDCQYEDCFSAYFRKKSNSKVNVFEMKCEKVEGLSVPKNKKDFQREEYRILLELLSSKKQTGEWRKAVTRTREVTKNIFMFGYNSKEEKLNEFSVFYLTSENYTETEGLKDLIDDFNCDVILIFDEGFYNKRLYQKYNNRKQYKLI